MVPEGSEIEKSIDENGFSSMQIIDQRKFFEAGILIKVQDSNISTK